MGRARQIASAEHMERILLEASAASTDVGDQLLEEDGFFINTEIGTTETPPEGFVISSSIAADAIDNTKLADDAVQTENIADDAERNTPLKMLLMVHLILINALLITTSLV